MPSRSKQQQKFMGMAHALKKGEMKPSDASPELKKVAKSMSDKDVKDFASTSHKGLPKKVKQEILHKLKEYASKMGTNTFGGGRDKDINESIVTEARYNKKYTLKTREVITLEVDRRGLTYGSLNITAYDKDNNKIGAAYFNSDETNNPKILSSTDTSVKPDWRRKGVATAIYNFAKTFGYKIVNSTNQTSDGNKFTKSVKEYASKMGRDHLGGDDYTSKKKGGLRDFDGYDNVDYNKNMPMDEVSSSDAYKISRMLGTAQQSTQDFIEDNKIDVKKLESYIKKLSPSKKSIIKDIINGSTDKRLSTIKKGLVKQVKESLDEACWKGYKEVGGKIKNGKQVPNCVPVSESMMSTLDLMRKDSKNIRDFIKKVLSDKDFRDMKGDKDFIKYLGSMYEGVTEGGIPQNWMQGRTSDYHTKLRGKDREYDDTNFDKENSGQEDLEESTDSLEYLKLLNKAFSTMPGSPKQKAIIKKINVIRKSSGEKPLKEYGQRLDLSYLEDEEARLDGTPKPKDAIDTDLDEQTLNELGIFPIGAFLQDLIPSSIMKTTTPKDKERLKATIKDLIFTLNRFWKQHNIPYRVREK